MTWPFGDLQPHHYRAIVLDPPWKFSAGTKSRPQHYPRMTDAEIGALPLADLAHLEGAFFFVWITSPLDGPRFWHKIYPQWRKQGLQYSARAFVWLKLHKASARGQEPIFYHRDSFHTGTGFTTRKNAEDCLLFKIGKTKRVAKNVREEIISPLREHSRKPDESYDRIRKFCAGPYAEMFSRETRAGWDVGGNEVGKFDREAV